MSASEPLEASGTLPVTLDDIQRAARQLRGEVLRTPIIVAPKLSSLTGAEVYVKCENLQVTNSFKDRGAFIKLSSLSDAERQRGVVAMSAGNHAQAVAYHASRLGIPATIVMPVGTPYVKVGNTEAWGATVILEGQSVSESLEKAEELAASRGLTLVHPFDDARIIAGQGTIGLEILADCPELDTIVVPIGGGGLISGIAVAVKSLNERIDIVGVQTELFPSMKAALRGETPIFGGNTLADGIAVNSTGRLTLEIARRLVHDVLTVDEDAIEHAICAFLSSQKTMVEGSGAAGLAALLCHPDRFAGRKVCLVLTGGNIDPRILASIMMRGLEREHKIISLRITIDDRPGTLGKIATVLGDAGANILEVFHRRTLLDVPAKGASLDITVELKDGAHAELVKDRLGQQGFPVHQI
ncbi:MAG: threonine ammonia-lyase [Methyloligellaceae bacterium]